MRRSQAGHGLSSLKLVGKFFVSVHFESRSFMKIL